MTVLQKAKDDFCGHRKSWIKEESGTSEPAGGDAVSSCQRMLGHMCPGLDYVQRKAHE